MPKAIIKSRYPDPEGGPPETIVRVGWTPGREHVEVATVMPNEHVRLPEPTLEQSNGWFVQLDRTGINELIRTLRQARDKAYGRDE